MEVIVKKTYLKDLQKVPKYIFKEADAALDKLRVSENLEESGLDYKKCKESKKEEKYYRIRVGDWRIGAELKHPKIIIITILTRGQIYKKFPPG